MDYRSFQFDADLGLHTFRPEAQHNHQAWLPLTAYAGSISAEQYRLR
jgi:hypothetical protein